ncbi:1-acylglycerol-3-phosphate O-acyltransferase [Propionibacterium sp. oral taxon 192 str. F0372]|uniref:lysophospholipid acyltransferase family protein n=1 Tax=Propionibacterium sp. oral taxon 192 TaxID=671222 RepID=UPI00035369D2|nr:lysophospholipid acyltransferase family protein [Propionibacterium sp. oral taxon 192]EPH02932.1 1-acylglycerol-3-phosphate O-acyltransferase [Propionibacterium sp. oral taxon 192 str. F0372]
MDSPGTPSSHPLAPTRARFDRLSRVNRESTTWVLKCFGPMLCGITRLWTRTSWSGANQLVAQGPMIVVANHISSLDPVLIGIFLAYNGRWPHFLARANLFDSKLLGPLLKIARQIPVERGSVRAKDSLVAAQRALEQGRTVVMYPEGTITLDPDEWPMAVHSGAARLAIATQVPVIPVGQWGANHALPPRGIHRFRLRRWPVTIVAGARIDLSEYGTDPRDRGAVNAASTRILDEVIRLVEVARNESAPQELWHPKLHCRVPRDQALQ